MLLKRYDDVTELENTNPNKAAASDEWCSNIGFVSAIVFGLNGAR